MPAVSQKQITIGPKDQGRRMSLDRFDRAVASDDGLYELNRGVIEMVDVPHPDHFFRLQSIRDQLIGYKQSHAGIIHAITGSMDSKILVASTQSERHPDLSVYLSEPPDSEDVWSIWIPAIVVEVVSPSSSHRDYHEKPEDYLEFGVEEYWIIDAHKQQMTSLQRWRGRWKPRIVKATGKYTTRHLPGFSLDLNRVIGKR